MQYSCYSPQTGEWGYVTNVTTGGVALAQSLSSGPLGPYALVLEGSRIFSLNQSLMEYSLQNGPKLLMTIPEYTNTSIISKIVSFNASSQIAVLRLSNSSYEVMNLTSGTLIPLPSMGGYEQQPRYYIADVQLATDSLYSLGILYRTSNSSIFCIYNVSSGTATWGMAFPQTPTCFTFAREGSVYRLVTADASGIKAYFIAGNSAGPPLIYPMQNVTSMGSTIVGSTILVYTTENYGNSTYPLLNLTLTSVPDLPWVPCTSVVSYKTVVGQGYSDVINVTTTNLGGHAETFNVTIYANKTSIQTQAVTLTSGNSKTITFTWNTKGFAYGNYNLSANVELAPGETNSWTGPFTYGTILLTIPGDVDGNHVVNILDIVKITSIYGMKQGNPSFNPNCDIGNYGVINILDVVAATSHYGQKW
jgi:hypothetical protein